mmetsp:Transcript_47576/g.107918  ORF Transcript_47576/g.107918 Transcript_47576/m.107918 type:complete len:238 (+) Transcript_47576:1049-1762(+)
MAGFADRSGAAHRGARRRRLVLGRPVRPEPAAAAGVFAEGAEGFQGRRRRREASRAAVGKVARGSCRGGPLVGLPCGRGQLAGGRRVRRVARGRAAGTRAARGAPFTRGPAGRAHRAAAAADVRLRIRVVAPPMRPVGTARQGPGPPMRVREGLGEVVAVGQPRLPSRTSARRPRGGRARPRGRRRAAARRRRRPPVPAVALPAVEAAAVEAAAAAAAAAVQACPPPGGGGGRLRRD